MITKTFKLTIATDNKKQMRKEEEYLSMVYGAEEIEALEQQPCEDCISRQAAIDALNEYFARIGRLKRRGLTKGEKAISLDTIGTIKTLPSAQPKTGHWIRCDILQEFKCSECRKCFRHKTNFCPNCGAKMKEAEDEVR